MDLDDATGRIGREQFFAEFIENADIIFSKENLNKIEAGFGKGVRSALEDILYRIKTGRNKPSGQNKMVNDLMNWINGYRKGNKKEKYQLEFRLGTFTVLEIKICSCSETNCTKFRFMFLNLGFEVW